MSTSVSGLSSNFFPSAENGFTTTTSGSVSSGATTVGLASVAGYSNGEVAVFVIDPTDAAKKQTFTGVIDTAGVQVTSVVWTAGTNQTHALGATVVDYATATHVSMITKGLLSAGLTQAGGMGAITPTSVTSSGTITAANFVQTGGSASDGWTIGASVPTTIVNNGNHSYTLTHAASILATKQPGMRNKYTRTVAAPTQCTDLEVSSSQYYSKTTPAGMTFTDDFTVSAWVKLESYQTNAAIASRYNGTSGWSLQLNSSGQLYLYGFNGGVGNYSEVHSYQSLPLGKWVHVTAQLDMSAFTATTTTSYIMFDGVDVPATITRAGTNPTALVQAGNLEIGSANATNFFDGKIAQVAIYSAKVTQATIKASMDQTLSGSETSLISAYSFNNSIVDLNTTNANNLTANGGALATATDTPFTQTVSGITAGATNYSITTAISSDGLTETVQVPEGDTIPTTGGISAVSYSTQKAPYGMPMDANKWMLQTLIKVRQSASGTANTWVNLNHNLSVPIGAWRLGYAADGIVTHAGVSYLSFSITLSTANNSQSDPNFTASSPSISSSSLQMSSFLSKILPVTLTAQTIQYLNIAPGISSTTVYIEGNNVGAITGAGYIIAEFAYL